MLSVHIIKAQMLLQALNASGQKLSEIPHSFTGKNPLQLIPEAFIFAASGCVKVIDNNNYSF